MGLSVREKIITLHLLMINYFVDKLQITNLFKFAGNFYASEGK